MALGLAGLGLAAWLYRCERAFAARAVTAPATIVALDLQPGDRRSDNINDRDDPTEAPTFQFATPEGLEVRARSSTSYKVGRFRIGQAVTIRYDPARPDQAEHADAVTLHLPSLITAFIAGLVLVIGAAMLLGLS